MSPFRMVLGRVPRVSVWYTAVEEDSAGVQVKPVQHQHPRQHVHHITDAQEALRQNTPNVIAAARDDSRRRPSRRENYPPQWW